MRTAVVRVDVDPTGLLAPEQLREGMATLVELAVETGVGVVEADLSTAPANRRQVEVLIEGDDAEMVTRTAVSLCARAFSPFGVQPAAGVLTYTSRGTDDDAHGVLAGLGLRGEVERVAGGEGWDIVHVTLDEADLRRVPESRVHTALEASLNCEVYIHTR
jgi:hypothetical protein